MKIKELFDTSPVKTPLHGFLVALKDAESKLDYVYGGMVSLKIDTKKVLKLQGELSEFIKKAKTVFVE